MNVKKKKPTRKKVSVLVGEEFEERDATSKGRLSILLGVFLGVALLGIASYAFATQDAALVHDVFTFVKFGIGALVAWVVGEKVLRLLKK